MTPSQTLADQIRSANAAFLGRVAELEALAGTMTAVPADKFTRHLRALRGTVAEHFALEEQNGYLSPVVSCRPDADVKRRTLLDEHRALLDGLDALVRAADAGEGLTGDLRDRVRHWVQDARAHEDRENEFFDQARDDEPC